MCDPGDHTNTARSSIGVERFDPAGKEHSGILDTVVCIILMLFVRIDLEWDDGATGGDIGYC